MSHSSSSPSSLHNHVLKLDALKLPQGLRHNHLGSAPYTFVATSSFLAAFGIEIQRDLHHAEQLQDVDLARLADTDRL